MRNRLRELLLNASGQTLSESALIYALIVLLGFVPLVILGMAVVGFWDDFASLFTELT